MTQRAGVLALAIFLVLTFTAGFIGSIFTTKSVLSWYPALVKPAWNPPSWLFGPVWTFLYITIAVSGWLVWKEGQHRSVFVIMGIFGLQLLLNALWSYLFFGLHNPGAAFADIVLLWLTIAFYILAAWSVSRPAAILFMPYLCWVGFATALNYSIWALNR